MDNLDKIIDSLSDEELDLLNSDPAMLAEFKAKHMEPEKEPSMLDKAAGGVARLIMRGGPGGVLGDEVKAGYAGLGDIVAGNGLDKAADSIKKVEQDRLPDTLAANMGSMVGGEFTPNQIAIMGGLGAIGDVVGPWAGNVLKGWGEKAALNAVGMTKTIAEKLGLGDLKNIAEFLLKPVELGGKKYAPVLTATSSTADMLAAAEEIQAAAGAQLGTASKAVDAAIASNMKSVGTAVNNTPVAIDLAGLRTAVEGFRNEFAKTIKNLGKPVIDKYETALADIDDHITRALTGNADTIFSDLAAARTAIGKLAFEHSSKMESTVALQKVWGAMSDTLRDAAQKVGGPVGADYAKANLVYHQVTAVVNALTGKSTKFAVKDLFAPGAFSFMGSVIGGVPGAIAGAVGGAAANAYGHQAVAAGLDASVPFLGSALRAAPQVMGAAVNPIIQAITGPNREK